MGERRGNAVVRICRWCGRTDTLMDLSTGRLLWHRFDKGRSRCWGSNKKIATPILPPQSKKAKKPRRVEVDEPQLKWLRRSRLQRPPRQIPLADRPSSSVHTMRGGLPTLGKR